MVGAQRRGFWEAEGKARIGVTSAEAELGYSRKQTGEPPPELQALQGPQRAKGALFWAVRVRAGQWETLPLALGNQLLQGRPWPGIVLGPDLGEGCGRLSEADVCVPAPILPICEPQSSFNGVKTLVLRPHPWGL